MRALLVVVVTGCSFHSGHSVAPLDDAPAQGSDGPMPDAIDAPAVTSPRTLTIDSTMLAADVTNIPLYVSLDATRVDYSSITDPNVDLRFFDPVTASDLAFEIDHWTKTGESGVWVKIPTLHHGATDQITMYFGASAAGTANPAATWGNGYQLVEHFESALANSANGNYAGTLAGATLGAGRLGSSAQLAGGTNQAVTFTSNGGLFDGWCTFTFDFWIRADYIDGNALGGEPHFMEKGSSLDLPRLYNASGAINLQIDMHFTNSNDAYLATEVAPQTWTYIAYTFDQNNLRMYRNGVQVASQSINKCLVGATSPFVAGSTSSGVITGALDEIRVADNSHSGNWILAEYLAMTGQSITY